MVLETGLEAWCAPQSESETSQPNVEDVSSGDVYHEEERNYLIPEHEPIRSHRVPDRYDECVLRLTDAKRLQILEEE